MSVALFLFIFEESGDRSFGFVKDRVNEVARGGTALVFVTEGAFYTPDIDFVFRDPVVDGIVELLDFVFVAFECLYKYHFLVSGSFLRGCIVCFLRCSVLKFSSLVFELHL